MRVINKWIIPGTKERYELHFVEYNEGKREFEVWSKRSQKHLKDTTAFNQYRGLMRTFGIKFEDEKDCIQKKMYLKDIIKLCN